VKGYQRAKFSLAEIVTRDATALVPIEVDDIVDYLI
jgi:hypothetical protein